MRAERGAITGPYFSDGGPDRSHTMMSNQCDRKQVRAKMPHCPAKQNFWASRTSLQELLRVGIKPVTFFITVAPKSRSLFAEARLP
jgi:hypothetical protein